MYDIEILQSDVDLLYNLGRIPEDYSDNDIKDAVSKLFQQLSEDKVDFTIANRDDVAKGDVTVSMDIDEKSISSLFMRGYIDDCTKRSLSVGLSILLDDVCSGAVEAPLPSRNADFWDKAALWDLRSQIMLHSVYYADYRNSYDVDTHKCYDFFEGYEDFIYEEIIEANADKDKEWLSQNEYKLFKQADNPDTLERWFYCFEENPLVDKIELSSDLDKEEIERE